jgi:hypothetical protein
MKRGFYAMIKIFKKYFAHIINMIKYPNNKIINSYIPWIDDCRDKPLTTVESKSEIDKSKVQKFTKEKKELMKNMIGKYSTPIDMNKVRDEERNKDNDI